MTALKKTRQAQVPLMAEFKFDITDTILATDGTVKAFSVAAPVADVIPLPPNATVIGGELVVETVSNETGTATIAVGDSGSATRYLAATNIKAAARTALTLTGYRGTGEDIRVTLANQNGNATAGTVTLRVLFTVQGRGNEALGN